MAGFPVPNWAQMALAQAAGLQMAVPVIVIDNDSCVTFMDLVTRNRFIVNKKDGRVVEDREERKEKNSDHQRKWPAEGHEGFL